MSIRVQYEMMLAVQFKTSVREVMAEALGGTTKAPDKAPESFNELASIIGAVGGSVFD